MFTKFNLLASRCFGLYGGKGSRSSLIACLKNYDRASCGAFLLIQLLQEMEAGEQIQVKVFEDSMAKRSENYETLLHLQELAKLALEGIKEPFVSNVERKEEVRDYISLKLQATIEGQLDILDLSSQFLSHVPESFNKIISLVVLNLSNNRLEVSITLFGIIFSWTLLCSIFLLQSLQI